MAIAYLKKGNYPVCNVSYRVNGKRVTYYRGGGEFAFWAEEQWQEEKAERAELRRQERASQAAEVHRLKELERQIRAGYLAGRRAVMEAAELAGLKWHKGHELRIPKTGGLSMDLIALSAADQCGAGAVRALVDPKFYGRCQNHLFTTAINAVADLHGEYNQGAEHEMTATAAAMKAAELAGPHPHPIIKTAAEAAAIAWAEACTLEKIALDQSCNLHFSEVELGRQPVEHQRRQADRISRMADRAWRRFNQSMRLLAEVHRTMARVKIRQVTRAGMTVSEAVIDPAGG